MKIINGSIGVVLFEEDGLRKLDYEALIKHCLRLEKKIEELSKDSLGQSMREKKIQLEKEKEKKIKEGYEKSLAKEVRIKYELKENKFMKTIEESYKDLKESGIY